jgi:hypothetical protein
MKRAVALAIVAGVHPVFDRDRSVLPHPSPLPLGEGCCARVAAKERARIGRRA